VALAARMVLQPKVLLMDEPTISVDVASAQMIKGAALHARQQWGTTLIIASHDGDWLADISDHTRHLFRGRLLGSGKQTLIFGPWKFTGNGVYTKALNNDQYFAAHGKPADVKAAVASIDANHMGLHATPAQIPPPLHRLKGVVLRQSFEQATRRVSAAVSVGGIMFNVYLDPSNGSATQFSPGQDVWVGYNPRAVSWY
jgi:tungstate transport system ATP-binding protein